MGIRACAARLGDLELDLIEVRSGQSPTDIQNFDAGCEPTPCP
jgi:hypothetical protein